MLDADVPSWEVTRMQTEVDWGRKQVFLETSLREHPLRTSHKKWTFFTPLPHVLFCPF